MLTGKLAVPSLAAAAPVAGALVIVTLQRRVS
jgi:hypothetical protein